MKPDSGLLSKFWKKNKKLQVFWLLLCRPNKETCKSKDCKLILLMNLFGKALNKQIWCVTDSDAPWNWLLIKDQGEEDKAPDPIRKSAWVVFCFNARFIFEFYCSLLSNNNSYTSLSETCVTQSLCNKISRRNDPVRHDMTLKLH